MTQGLTDEQLKEYAENGIVFPVRGIAPADALNRRTRFEQLEAAAGRKMEKATWLHLFFPWAYKLVTEATILDAVESILGPEIVIASSMVLCKYGSSPSYTTWHQDGIYSKILSAPSTTAWIALTDSNTVNGCMRVVPGSQRGGQLPHVETYGRNNLLKQGEQVTLDVDEANAVDVTLGPGEMSLHHNYIVHGSRPNNGADKRIGFIARYTTPQLARYDRPVVIARGNGSCGHLNVLSAGELPASDSFDEWRAFTGE